MADQAEVRPENLRADLMIFAGNVALEVRWRDEYVPGTQQAWIAQVGAKPVRI